MIVAVASILLLNAYGLHDRPDADHQQNSSMKPELRELIAALGQLRFSGYILYYLTNNE